MSKVRQLRLSTGFKVPLDGDLLAVVEALYQEITLGSALSASFETMRSEILGVIDQMTAAEQRVYLAESLFLNSVTYENEMLSAYVRRLGAKPAAPTTDAKRQSTAPIRAKKAKKQKPTKR